MGSYNIEFDDNGNPILPKYAETMHRRAMAATTSRDTEKVHAEFIKHETDILSEFYSRMHKAAGYVLAELSKFHSGQPTQMQQVTVLIQQYMAEAGRLSLKLTEIEHFLEDERRLFDIWRQEDDRVRHARLSKHLLKQEEGLYKVDRRQLKVSAKAKSVCLEAADTLRKIATMLERVRRAFEEKEFRKDDLKMLFEEFNTKLLPLMNRDIALLHRLEDFERKNIALWEKQMKLDFLTEKGLKEDGDFIL